MMIGLVPFSLPQPYTQVVHNGVLPLLCCSALFIEPENLSLQQSYRQPICSFITWGATLVQPSPLGQAEPLSFHATTVGGACYRVEYGCVKRIKKAVYNCPR
jgi:hypothetical protein